MTRLIGKWLNAGVMERGNESYPERGTPQGGVISPLLSNIYLHEVLDRWFTEVVLCHLQGRAFLVRFADDALMAFTDRHDAERVMRTLSRRFAKYGLTVHAGKTQLLRFFPQDAGVGAGIPEWQFPIPWFHSFLGTLAPGESDCDAEDRFRSTYPSATSGVGLVQAAPACATTGAADRPSAQAVRPLRILRHYWQCSGLGELPP